MKKTSTYKSPETSSASRGDLFNDVPYSGTDAGFEPDAQVIQNILNYSKAVSVKNSSFLSEIITLNN
ncbi:MAG TPA: hypothetical protein VNZ86_13790 [Bacteroidia bacterium]|jgi:hypothetical protein|nr:hypothetical protein [Bacteroidia bacterium]